MAIDVKEVNQARGDILIRSGKGRKPRHGYIGKNSSKAVRKYLKHRADMCEALWVTHPRLRSERLSYGGLRGIIRRNAKDVNINAPMIHDFRRTFCITMLRNGVDIFTLAKLMGHEYIDVLKCYLKQATEDTREAHRKASPVDRWGL